MAETAAEALGERNRLHGAVQASGTKQMQRGIVARVVQPNLISATAKRLSVRDKRRRIHSESIEHEYRHTTHSQLRVVAFAPPADPPSIAAFLASWQIIRALATSATLMDSDDCLITPIFGGDIYS